MPFQDPQDQWHHLPPQDPSPRAVRRLAFGTMEMQQATDSLPQLSPSLNDCEALRKFSQRGSPCSSIVRRLLLSVYIYIYIYRMEEYERQNGALQSAWERQVWRVALQQHTRPTGRHQRRL
jgi:hypothetical protein